MKPAAPSRTVRWAYPLLGLALLALYAPTLARGVTFSDGPEIVTAITTLGVTHPTGYPIFVVLAHCFTVLFAVPLPQCVKVEVFNALCGVGAALFTARAAREVARMVQGGEGDRADADVAGLVGGGMLGIAPLLWEQVRIPEVYPFHILLVTCSGYAWIRFEVTRDARYVLGAALSMGTGLAHHVTMVYMLPSAFLYLLVRQPSFFVAWLGYPASRLARLVKRDVQGAKRAKRSGGWWGFPVACLLGALPLLSYAYLIWANAHTTGPSWNDVNGWDRLIDHVTGKQYRGFVGSAELESWWLRIKKIPIFFDKQFLPVGTVLFFAGLFATFRRAWRIGVLLMAVLLFNVAHGIYYAVGDYANYYLPALFSCAVLIGAGYARFAGWLRARPAASRPWVGLAVLGAMLVAGAIGVLCYALLTRRVPAALAAHGGAPLVVPLAALGAAAGAAAVWVRGRGARLRRQVPAGALPVLLAAFVTATFLPVAILRADEIGSDVLIGESWGAEVAGSLPPGSVFLTQGDGFIFTMWYEHHVLHRGLDFATLDVGTLKAAWYQKYLRTHYPLRCDPLSEAFGSDPAAYRSQCGTFEERMAHGDPEAWVSMGSREARGAPSRGVRAALAEQILGARSGEGAGDPAGPPGEPVVRGADRECKDQGYRASHPRSCKCWHYGRRKEALAEDCVASAEEGGIVPREPVEVAVHRIIQDHIDERPVYERNAVTFWVGSAKENARGWSGPAYQRLSADYTLINRGRYNQVVYLEDVEGLDPCSGDTLQPIRLRPFQRRGERDEDVVRRPYRPNPWPVVIKASFLTRAPLGTDDDALRELEAGDTVHLKLDWFERFHHDAGAADRRGSPIHHGLRLCVFDPDGRRVATAATISGKGDRLTLFETTPSTRRGVYTVQACSVGEVLGDGPVPDRAPCARIVLEYTFTLREKARE